LKSREILKSRHFEKKRFLKTDFEKRRFLKEILKEISKKIF